MIAHYVKFISKVTQGIFMFLAVITSDALLKKCTSCTHDCEASLRKALSSYLHMQLVVIMWVATRFQYHYAFCLLIDTILESLHQLIFFSNLIWKGKIVLRCKLPSITCNYTSPLGQSVCLFIMVKYQNTHWVTQ